MPGPDIILNDEMLAPLRSKVEQRMQAHLGVDLDEEMRDAIAAQVQTSANDVVSKAVGQITDDIVLGSHLASRAAGKEKISSGLVAGLEGVKAISQATAYLDLLKESARMLKAKFDALVEAGFTADQAFRLVEAETLAKGGRVGR